ncbi:MAG: hypothetical protein UMV23_04520, partial [Halanaerobium sp.]|nr:hypothetical protein [Halanaerobium sp.]
MPKSYSYTFDPPLVTATFLSRPNRFIAEVEVEGKISLVHVPNTGRMRELLVPGAPIALRRAAGKKRKTEFDLSLVQKGDVWVAIDSRLPNIITAN